MSEIPEDIQESARELNDMVQKAPEGLRWAVTIALAESAILAERKRCADALRSVFVRHDGSLSVAGDMALEAIEP